MDLLISVLTRGRAKRHMVSEEGKSPCNRIGKSGTKLPCEMQAPVFNFPTEKHQKRHREYPGSNQAGVGVLEEAGPELQQHRVEWQSSGASLDNLIQLSLPACPPTSDTKELRPRDSDLAKVTKLGIRRAF